MEWIKVPATEVRVGDRLSAKVRITKVHASKGVVRAQTRLTGSRSPSIEVWAETAEVRVLRKEG